MLIPIHVMSDSYVDSLAQQAINSGISEFRKLFGQVPILNYGSRQWSAGSFSSADWYINNASKVFNDGTWQVDAESINMLMWQEPWQEGNHGHIDICVTSQNITTKSNGSYLAFCFGAATGNVATVSTFQFRNCPKTDRFFAIKTTFLHELGHTLQMAASLHRDHTEYNLGIHCANHSCVMQQGLCVNKWVQHALECARNRQWYCQECIDDAKRYLGL